MRRIYESSALSRDDDDPYKPNEGDERVEPRAARHVPATTLSRWLVPRWLRRRAISVEVSTPKTAYERGAPVPMAVTMKNAMPFPVTIPTRSRLLWTWHVDGVREASRVAETPSQGPGDLVFERGERKVFSREWHQTLRVSDSEWEQVEPGEYTLSAAINVDDPTDGNVYDETTVRIE